jgi:hypothetical protein
MRSDAKIDDDTQQASCETYTTEPLSVDAELTTVNSAAT